MATTKRKTFKKKEPKRVRKKKVKTDEEKQAQQKLTEIFSSIKCKLLTLVKDPKLVEIIKNCVILSNKVFFEGIFLLNMTILKQLESNQNIDVNLRLINQCINLVTPNSKELQIMDDNTELLFNVFDNEYSIDNNIVLEKFTSINRTLEYACKEYLTNIKNHCFMHFWKYQGKYIYSIVSKKAERWSLKVNILRSMANCIQSNMNTNTNIDMTNIKILSPNILKHKEFEIIKQIMVDIIIDESKNIPSELRNKDGKVTTVNLKREYNSVLKYYYMLIKQLEENDRKRFSVLPQLSIGIRYIKFDTRTFCSIYNKWKGTSISIPTFESDKNKYFREIFTLENNKKIKDMYMKYSFEYPLSVATDGYTGVLLFQKQVPKYIDEINDVNEIDKVDDINDHIEMKENDNSGKTKSKKIKKKVNLTEINPKKGLYDADEVESTHEFLNQFYKASIDPNMNNMLFCRYEDGLQVNITRGFYKQISHINRTNMLVKRQINEHKMNALYKELISTSRKTSKLSEYMKYVKIIRSNWDQIWNFYSRNQLLSLYFDVYIHKRKAITTIVRKLVPKKSWRCIDSKIDSMNLDYFDKEKHKDLYDLPILIAFGKGNGNTTISNLKNSSPKGPIKAIAKELARFCLVILTDEFRTSRLCSDCKEGEVIHPKTDFTRKTFTKKEQKIDQNKVIKSKKVIKKECHGLGYCKHKIHSCNNKNVPKIWQRDVNASINILHIMTVKLLNQDLGLFSRKIKNIFDNDKSNQTKGIKTKQIKGSVKTTQIDKSVKPKIKEIKPKQTDKSIKYTKTKKCANNKNNILVDDELSEWRKRHKIILVENSDSEDDNSIFIEKNKLKNNRIKKTG